FLSEPPGHPRQLHSFPTRRSSDLEVQITVAESLGVETRGAYYEEAGALRDMMQNHLLQLLCLIAMEPPVSFEAGPVRDEKNKVIDRKSTRLNSSHVAISYAVFCLK